jgi:molybdenum cofactor cytidylyltransferase
MIGAVVLAAGRATRMGTQKLLLPLGGKPIIAWVMDELLLGRPEKLVLVVGSEGAQIQEVLAGRQVLLVENPDPNGDMLSSLRCGLRALPASCEAILVALGDQPGITHELVSELVRAFYQTGRGIIVPAHEGRRGHPLLFAARFRDELLSRHDGVGLRGLLDAHAEEILEVRVSTASVLEDLDTPEDYQRHLNSAANALAAWGRGVAR